MNDETQTLVLSFERAIKLIDTSLILMKSWKRDLLLLEEYLRINRRGWRLLFQAFGALSEVGDGGSLCEIIGKLNTCGILKIKVQNLYDLFFRESSMAYYAMLDSLAGDDEKETATKLHDAVKEWSKGFAFRAPSENAAIRDQIEEINCINLRFIGLHFVQGDEDKRIYAPVFREYYAYWNDLFLPKRREVRR